MSVPRPLTLEEVDREIAELDTKIAELNAAVQRRSNLQNYKALVIALSPDGAGAAATNASKTWFNSSKTTSQEATEIARPVSMNSDTFVSEEVMPNAGVTGDRSPTAEWAHTILSAYGHPMHMLDIVKRMRQQYRWGTNDDDTDRNRLYSAMHRLPEKFAKKGRSIWAAR